MELVNLEYTVLRKISAAKCCPWTKYSYARSHKVSLCAGQTTPDTSQLSSTTGQWYTTQGHLPPFLVPNSTGTAWHMLATKPTPGTPATEEAAALTEKT